MLSSNRNLKHVSTSKKPSKVSQNSQNSQRHLAEMTKDLKKRQDRLMSLEEKNLGLVQLNRTLIEDLKRSQSNEGLIKKYEEQIRYLKESQQELFEESCEQKTQIKLLQKKIEKYLEGNVEEKNMVREYYNGYFNEQIYKEKSKNEMIIKELKQENDNLKQILHGSSIRRKDSIPNVQENIKTSKKSSHLLSTMLMQETPLGLPYQESTEKKLKKSNYNKERKGSFQFSNNYNNGNLFDETDYDDRQPVGIYRRMSNQVNNIETGFSRLDSMRSSKNYYPSTARFIEEKNFLEGDRKKKWKDTQDDIKETLKSMKKELKLLKVIT